jgi:hypothetical protein
MNRTTCCCSSRNTLRPSGRVDYLRLGWVGRGRDAAGAGGHAEREPARECQRDPLLGRIEARHRGRDHVGKLVDARRVGRSAITRLGWGDRYDARDR